MRNTKVIITRYGPPDVLRVVEEDLPEPKRGEVRVRVLVTSASFTDTLLRKGMYPDVRVKPPFSPGYDMVGVVDKRGEEAQIHPVGARVAALTVYGAYAEYLCLRQEELIPVPANIDPAGIVSLLLTYMTAYQMLYRTARISGNHSVLIHGAGGAVGTALLQLGKIDGLKMFATARKSKHDILKKLGAEAIDYTKEDFVGHIRTSEEKGVDAVFDCIGGDYFRRSFSVLRPGGILVAYGFQKAVQGKGRMIDFLPAFLSLKLLGARPGSRKAVFYSITTERKKHPLWFREDFAALLDLLKQNKIRPVISRRMPLVDAAKAHALLDASAVEGKIILVVHEK